MHLPGHRLRPALNSPFTRMIVGVTGKPNLTGQRGNVENNTASVLRMLAHDSDSPGRHPCGAEKQGLHFQVGLLFGCRLRIAGKRVPGVVHHGIEVEVFPEVLGGRLKGSIDGCWRCDV